MRTRTAYVCEVCESEYRIASKAIECEAHGLPSPVPWLTIGESAPWFGPNGVEYAIVEAISVYKPFDFAHVPHGWLCRIDNGEPIDAECFDPRVGHDAFRYDGTPTDLRVWAERMAELGFAESEASAWVRQHVAHWRAVHAKGTGR